MQYRAADAYKMPATITTIVGTRAQLIKMAPVIRELESRGLSVNLLFTGQHRETMDELLREFSVRSEPRYVYRGKEIAGIGRMLRWLPRVLFRLLRHSREYFPSGPGPHFVLVHGDTVSTLAGALAAKLLGSRVAHIESGLRSFKLFHPFPEELTRLAVFRLTDVAFCPGDWATSNMQRYRVEMVNTGANTLLDAMRYALTADDPGAPVPDVPYCVVSIHRFENIFFHRRLEHIVSLIEQVAREYRVVFVAHPATRKRLQKSGLLKRLADNANIRVIPRSGYLAFIKLIGGARFVVTDGGSNQEELSYLGIPTLLLRKASERMEGMGSTVTVSGYRRDTVLEFLNGVRVRARGNGDLIDNESVRPSGMIADWFSARVADSDARGSN